MAHWPVPPDDEEADARAAPDEIYCKHCGAGPYSWINTGVRWALVGERGKLHVCHRIKPEDFG